MEEVWSLDKAGHQGRNLSVPYCRFWLAPIRICSRRRKPHSNNTHGFGDWSHTQCWFRQIFPLLSFLLRNRLQLEVAKQIYQIFLCEYKEKVFILRTFLKYKIMKYFYLGWKWFLQKQNILQVCNVSTDSQQHSIQPDLLPSSEHCLVGSKLK